MHTFIRFCTCPFVRILPHVPRDARSLLEIGAGHGVFSQLAADRGVARVVAVEPDIRKALLAHGVDGVSFIAGFDDSVRGRFDAIALIDVLYTIPLAQWDDLLARAAERLPPGGTLLIKEQDPTARMKNAWNRAQEWFTQNVLRVTLAHAFSYEAPEAFVARLQRHGFGEVAVKRIDFGYPHPHLLFVAKR